MTHYKVTLSYKGTLFFGWQSQPEKAKQTVQGTIYEVIRRISKYRPCRVVGASRTDAGVHAQGQVAKITIPQKIAPDQLLLGMNSLLPKDIRIIECETCLGEFNPVLDSISKEYHYYFSNESIEHPLLSDLLGYVSSPLDFRLMKEGADHFIGEHDFFNFSRRDTNALTTNRVITSCEILKAEFPLDDSCVHVIKVVGGGFLKQMVRYMVGSLFEVGLKNIAPNDLLKGLKRHQEGKLSAAAKSKGLHLVKITY